MVPGGLDARREDERIPCLQWLVEKLSHRHSVEVFAIQQSGEPLAEFAGAKIHAVAGRSLFGVVRLILRAHRAHKFDVVHGFWATRPGLIAAVAAFFMRRPAFIHVAGGELVALPEIAYGSARTWKGRKVVEFVLRRAAVASAANSVLVKAAERFASSVQYVPLGVDTDRWPVVPPVQIAEAPYRLIHVASLNRVKNQVALLRAAAKLCSTDFPFHLDIVGVDTLDGEIHQLAKRLRLDDFVTFHGWLPQPRVQELMAKAHLHLVTSVHEAGPVVAREAAVSGVVTVGSPVGHVADWAPRGAVVVDTEDSVSFANAIRTLLRDDEQRLKLARAAQQTAVQEDIDWTVAQFETMYRNGGAG